jgi:hypothetical protein
LRHSRYRKQNKKKEPCIYETYIQLQFKI